MNYEDFTCNFTSKNKKDFVLCEEDKTSIASIEYWFRLLDLDENGIITYIYTPPCALKPSPPLTLIFRGYEMNYFYEE